MTKHKFLNVTAALNLHYWYLTKSFMYFSVIVNSPLCTSTCENQIIVELLL